MWKKILLSIVLITGAAGTGFAQDQRDVNVEFEGIYWFSELRANAQASGETSRGTEFNLERDAGLGDKDIATGRFTWFTGPKSRLVLDYAERDFHGERVLDRQIVFNDTTYNVGASVQTDLTFKFARFGWIWQFINQRAGQAQARHHPGSSRPRFRNRIERPGGRFRRNEDGREDRDRTSDPRNRP